MSDSNNPESLDDALVEIERLNSLLSDEKQKRSRAEENLETQRQNFQDSIKNINAVTYRTTLDGILLDVSDSAEIFFGVSPDELVGRSVSSLYKNIKDREVLIGKLREDGVVKNYEVTLVGKDNEEFICLVNATLKKEKAQTPIITGGLTDITEKRIMESSLAKLQERLQLALSATSDGIWDWNIAEKSISFSKKYYEMLGYSEGEFSPGFFAWLDLLHPDDRGRCKKFIEEYVAAGKCDPYHIEFRMRKKDGSYKWIMGRGNIVSKDDEGRPLRMVGTHVDIHELKNVQHQLADAYDVMNKFLANMSHELRTPLNHILGGLQLLEMTKDPYQSGEYRSMIKQGAERLLSMISDVLECSRLTTNQVVLEESRFPIVEIVDNVKANYDGRVIIENDVPGLMMKGDPIRIDQALDKIVNNAVKFSENKDVLVSYTVERDIDTEVDYLVMTVVDQGIGVAEENQCMIFDRFRQESEGFCRPYDGSGLGLSIAKTLVEMMGGSIALESKIGKGSRFTLKVPLSEYEILTEYNGFDYLKEFIDNPDAKILIVEDERTNALALGGLIGQMNIDRNNRLEYAYSAEQAYNMIHENKYGIVMMDIGLPGESGDELTKRLKEEGCSSVFIAVTANALPSDQVNYAKQFDGYVPKPVNKERLANSMKRALKKNKSKAH